MQVVEPQVLMNGSTKGLDNFEMLQKASKDLLYEGCAKEFIVLCIVLDLMKLKATHGWSDASFTDFLDLLTNVLSRPNNLPKSTYFAKKLISPLSLGMEKIHACPNHSIIYLGDHKDAMRCPRCKHSRYRKNAEYDEGGADDTSSGKRTKNKKMKGRRRKKGTIIEFDYDDRKILGLVM